EHQRDVVLQCPGKNAFAKLRNLLAVLEHDRVLADEIDARDMAVEVHTHARPVEAGRNLLDMRRLACPVVALDHYPAVMLEGGENRERQRTVEKIVGIAIRDMRVSVRLGWHFHVGIDVERLAYRDGLVRKAGDAAVS